MQPLDIWRSREQTTDSTTLEVFKVSDSVKLSVFNVFGNDLNQRCHFKTWSSTPSDLADCTCLTNSRAIVCDIPLNSPKVPVVCLLDQLDALNWLGTDSMVEHSRNSGLWYDKRNFRSKRAYFQCVLASKSIFDKGFNVGCIGVQMRIQIFLHMGANP